MAKSNKFYGYTESEARKILMTEAKRLKGIAKKHWDAYITGYKPKEYRRTGNSQKSLSISSNIIKLPDGSLGIKVYWKNDLAWHRSYVSGSKMKGHSVWLISEGWHSKKLEKMKNGRRAKVYRFTYFEGTNYLTKVYRDYKSGAPKGITLTLETDLFGLARNKKSYNWKGR